MAVGNPVAKQWHDLRRRMRLRTPVKWAITNVEDETTQAHNDALGLEQLASHPRLEAPAIAALRSKRSRWLSGVVSYPRLREQLPYHPTSQVLPVLCESSAPDRTRLVVACLDRDGVELTRTEQGHDARVALHPQTMFLRIGVIVQGKEEVRLHRLSFGHRASGPRRIPAHSDVLLLTNEYPSDDDLYRNAFVHSRVLGYKAAGREVDVFRYSRGTPATWHDFQGVHVLTASDESLRTALAHSGYRHVLVHFLNAGMWAALEPHLDTTRVTVWVHGYEVQPWHRRAFAYTDDTQLDGAKRDSATREELWRRVLANPNPKLRFVFVSQTLRRMVEDDYGLTLDPSRYNVVHNPIDTTLFAYEAKPDEQRLRVLSIRPFASRVYANDLTVEAIALLRAEPEFASMRFTIIGDGPLFDATVAPLQGLANVELHKEFVTQQQIAQLHKAHGVFLCPSRMDSQGVSRDEAMASGLVPVTSAVAAIPEFVDEASGILAAPESARELADGLLRLVRDPALFQRLSHGAAERVRRDRAAADMTRAELAIIDAVA